MKRSELKSLIREEMKSLNEDNIQNYKVKNVILRIYNETNSDMDEVSISTKSGDIIWITVAELKIIKNILDKAKL